MKRVLALVLWAAVFGCGPRDQPPLGDSGSLPEDLRAKVAKMDARDGKTDGTVRRCLTCALSMAGHEKFTVSHGGVKFHLCSALCEEAFRKDPEGALRAVPLKE